MNKTLANMIREIIHQLENGDPVAAVFTMEIALDQPMDWDTKRTLGKAKDEAEFGSPEKAETLLGLIKLDAGSAKW